MAKSAPLAADRNREARLRRLAAKMGLALRKSRTADPTRMDFGRYRIVAIQTGTPITGTYPFAYSLTLDEVEEALVDLLENPREEALSDDSGLVGRPFGVTNLK